jgi:hypothetical protein
MAQIDGKPVRPPAIIPADPAVPPLQVTGAEPCAQTDPEEWFPQHGHNPTAVRLCLASCPLLADCRAWALANPTLASDGIWGGLTRAQRAGALRKSMRKAA